MTTLFTRNLMKGIADGMIDGGAMAPFGNDDLATGIFDKIASDLGLPAILEEHLPTDAYVKIGQYLLHASKTASDAGYGANRTTEMLSKQAASMDLSDRAIGVAAYYMDKAAEEASLNGTGSNTPESAAATNAIARLDQANRSSLQYLVGMGNTDMPEGGIVGRQMVHPMAPKGPGNANSLSHLDKMANSEDMSSDDMEMTPEERELLDAHMNAERSEKVARAITFMEGLVNRGAFIDGKIVLASAILADSETTGLEVMASIVQHTKTAAELDEHMGGVMGAGAEHGSEADPHLVQAIEHALAEHAGADVDEDEETEDAEEHAEKAASLMRDLAEKGRGAARRAYEAAKGHGHAAAEYGKRKAHEGAEYLKRKAHEKGTALKEEGRKRIHEATKGPEASASEQARSAARKAKAELSEKAEATKARLKGVAESAKNKAREGVESAKTKARAGMESAKTKAREGVESAKTKAREGAEYAKTKGREGVEYAKSHKKEIGLAGAGIAAGALATHAAHEKDGALLDFLKAAADGSLNEVEENTPEDAAHYNANAELDMENRAPGEYLEGAGETELPNVGHRGASMDAPKGPAKLNPDNAATRGTKSASFDYKVKAAAEFWGPKLPSTMPQSEKRAHVIALAGMPSDMQAGYVGSLYSR